VSKSVLGQAVRVASLNLPLQTRNRLLAVVKCDLGFYDRLLQPVLYCLLLAIIFC